MGKKPGRSSRKCSASPPIQMNITKLIPFLSLAGTVAAGTENFDRAAGAAPAGWTVMKTGDGSPKWTVEKDDSAPSKPNVLRQSGKADYPLCIRANANVKDGHVETKFKAVSGKEDQAAGVIWRFKDPDNYYICRANALEGNIVLYKVEKGKRSSLDIVGRKGGYGVKEPVPSGQWHALRVEFSGNKFGVIFNGKKLFDVEDDTFKDSGNVGLWTKADSVMLFDDFSFGDK
jgi:hypothetical protein